MSNSIIIAVIIFILVIIIVILAGLFNTIYKNKYIKYNEFVKKINSHNKNEIFLLIYKTSKFTCFKEFDKQNDFIKFQIDNKNYISVIKGYKINDYVQYSQLE